MKNRSRSKIAIDCRGFSLIELLVVMIIMGLLIALVGPKVLKHIQPAKADAAKAQIGIFVNTLEMFYLDVNRFPTTSEGLEALWTNPGIDNWNGPYSKKKIPKDPWGNEYIYNSPGQNNTEYEIMSYGADGSPGGEKENKDIVSWE